MLRGLADVTVRPLLIIFETSWCLGRVPEDWKEANVTPIFKKGKEEDPGNCSLVSLTLIPGKVMEQLTLETICSEYSTWIYKGEVMLTQPDSLQ